MTTQTNDRPIHWDYVLSMEEDLARLSRFVDFSANSGTFSLEIARLLMAACAETDVVLKQICEAIEPGCGADKIDAYRPIVLGKYPDLPELLVTIDRYGLVLRPWREWTEKQPPAWWTANNHVKHHRAKHFENASLKNCLEAVAGLFGAVLYLYHDRIDSEGMSPPPDLLRVPGMWWGDPRDRPQRVYYHFEFF